MKYHAFFIALSASVLFVLVTPIFTTESVRKPGALQHLEFGWPLTFVSQDQRFLPPWPPNRAVFGSILETPTDFLPTRFLLNVVVVFGVLVLVSYIVSRSLSATRRATLLRGLVFTGYGGFILVVVLIGVFMVLALASQPTVHDIPGPSGPPPSDAIPAEPPGS